MNVGKFVLWVTQCSKTCCWKNTRPMDILAEPVLYFYEFFRKLYTLAMCTLQLSLIEFTVSKCCLVVTRHCLAQELMNMELKLGKLFYHLETLCHSIMTISDISIRHSFSLVALVMQILYEQLKTAISLKFINCGIDHVLKRQLQEMKRTLANYEYQMRCENRQIEKLEEELKLYKSSEKVKLKSQVGLISLQMSARSSAKEQKKNEQSRGVATSTRPPQQSLPYAQVSSHSNRRSENHKNEQSWYVAALKIDEDEETVYYIPGPLVPYGPPMSSDEEEKERKALRPYKRKKKHQKWGNWALMEMF